MTNSEIFTAAHKLAKTFKGDYVACFSLALSQVRAGIFKVNTLKGEPITVVCEVGRCIGNTFGKNINVIMYAYINGFKYEAGSYFDYYAVSVDHVDRPFISLDLGMEIINKFEKKVSINQSLFGSQVV